MFKKNPNRPSITLQLKKVADGYRIIPNEALNLFTIRKIVRSAYRPDMTRNQAIESSTGDGSNSISHPPSHITLPACSKWFSTQRIHPMEVESFPQFLKDNDGSEVFSFTVRNEQLYRYYRNTIVSMWRENVKKYLSLSLCRRNILGDVSAIMRIHGFLENWGLINFPSKEHKGRVLQKGHAFQCFVCEDAYAPVYYAAKVEDISFQICSYCFQSENYPQSIKKVEFQRVIPQKFKEEEQLGTEQVIRMLESLNNMPNSNSRQRDRDYWTLIQKEFPSYSKEQIIKTFLFLPLNIKMDCSIFDNKEDIFSAEPLQIKQPSIFEDYANTLQSSIAMSYFKWKRDPDQYKNIGIIMAAGVNHAQRLVKDQEKKVEELVKMSVDMLFSKLQLKAIFIQEYDKLVQSEKKMVQNLSASHLADQLKAKMGWLQHKEDNALDIDYINDYDLCL